MVKKLGCDYFEGKIQWGISISPKFVNISCFTRNLRVGLNTTLYPEKSAINFDINYGYTCGADTTECVMSIANTTLVVGSGMYRDPGEGEPYGFIDFQSEHLRGRISIPYEVSELIFGIVKGEPNETLEELGASRIHS
jgi:hypothetical protein